MADFVNKFNNGDCFEVLDNMISSKVKVDNVITSPPYNTARHSKYHFSEKAIKNHEGRYDIFLDDKTDEEYLDWTVELFNKMEKVLSENGSIMYNISYSSEKTNLIWFVITNIIQRTDFEVADVVYWKKSSALPNNSSSNKLTRIIEPVFVFCRKSEFRTFKSNKVVKSTSKTGQKYYSNVFNYIEARNNDKSTKLNKATYSSDLVKELISMYVKDGSIVLDPFMGTGTTAIGCLRYNQEYNTNLKYVGIELSENQVKYSEDRVKELLGNEINTEQTTIDEFIKEEDEGKSLNETKQTRNLWT